MKMLRWTLIGLVLVAFGIATAGAAEAIDLKGWDNQINNPGRFKVLSDFEGAAVLDKETQLVWEQSHQTGAVDWLNAQSLCIARAVGGRMGWRLPTIQELLSLVDHQTANLPAGHPFSLESNGYWSATTAAGNASVAHTIVLGFPAFGVAFTNFKENDNRRAWCVRGGQGVDPQ